MAFNVTPEVYFHRHVKGSTPNLSFQVTITDSTFWYLFNDPKMVFSIEGQLKAEHNGGGESVSVNIGLANTVNDLDYGLHELFLRVLSNTGEQKSVQFYLIVSESNTNNVFPNEIHFESIRNVEEAAPQNIYIASTDYSSITLPDWMQVMDEEIFATGRIITVQPKYFMHTPDPNYSGDVTISFSSGTKEIPVTYKINSGYDTSYSKQVHFTRDNDEMIFYKTINETSFLRLFTDIKIFGYKGEVKDKLTIPFDLVFVGNRAKINLGKEIESYIKLFEKPLARNNRVNAFYPPVEVNMAATELKYSDFSIVNQDAIPTQYFLKGRNPVVQAKVDKPFWLAFRPNAFRTATLESIVFLQIFKPAAQSIKGIKVFVNDNHVQTIQPGVNGHDQTKAYFLYASFNLSSLTIIPGDKVSFEYEGILERREFIVKPKQPHSFFIAFQTNWETMDIVEFTGPSSIPISFENKTTKIMRNYVEVVHKIETENPQSLIINTGWLDEEEVPLYNEIAKSPKAFLLPTQSLRLQMMENAYTDEVEKKLELVPVFSKIATHDNEENQISFDVEFEINKVYGDEVYSR